MSQDPANSDNTLSIRPAEQRDAELLADLGARTFSDAYACTLSAGDLEDYLRTAFSPGQMLEDVTDPNVLLFLGWSRLRCAFEEGDNPRRAGLVFLVCPAQVLLAPSPKRLWRVGDFGCGPRIRGTGSIIGQTAPGVKAIASPH